MVYTKTSYPVARKEHTCLVCFRTINIGDQYCSNTSFDGEVLTWKACLPCEQATMKARNAGYGDIDDYISSEVILEWAQEFQHTDDIALQLVQKAGG